MIRREFLAGAAAASLAVHGTARGQAAQAAAAASGPRPAEDFAVLPFLDDPTLSPDGMRYAAKLAVGGVQYLAIKALFETTPPAIIASGGRDINWWRWVNDEWLIAGVGAMDKYDGIEFYLRRVVGISADGKKVVPLAFDEAAQNADDVVWMASDGTPRIRLAMQKSIYLSEAGFWPSVSEINVATGRTKRVLDPEPGVTRWYADATGAVRVGVGFSQGGRTQKLLYRDGDSGMFRVLDRASSRKGESLLFPILLSQEPGQAVAIDDKDGYDAVYRLDLKTLTLGERIYGVKGYDVSGIVVDRAEARLLGVATTENARRVHWLDADLAKVQGAVDASVPGRKAAIVSMDAARQRFLIHLGGADRPGAYYFMDQAQGKMDRMAFVNEKFRAVPANPVRTIRYKARDGLEIAAVLTLPARREAKRLALIVMPHGGPFARDAEQWDWWAQFLAERGYAVVQPNFRGSSGFGTDFAKKAEGQWGLAMQDDLNDAIAELARQGIADPKRVGIVGGSYGGYAALRAAQRDGALYRCAVSFAGVSDLPALLKYDSRFLHSGRGSDWLKAQATDLKGVSPINFPEQFSIPVLLVHGKADRRVPVKQSREMAEKLKRAGKAVRYVEQPEGDHFLSREADRVALLKEMEAFLGQHVPA